MVTKESDTTVLLPCFLLVNWRGLSVLTCSVCGRAAMLWSSMCSNSMCFLNEAFPVESLHSWWTQDMFCLVGWFEGMSKLPFLVQNSKIPFCFSYCFTHQNKSLWVKHSLNHSLLLVVTPQRRKNFPFRYWRTAKLDSINLIYNKFYGLYLICNI